MNARNMVMPPPPAAGYPDANVWQIFDAAGDVHAAQESAAARPVVIDLTDDDDDDEPAAVTPTRAALMAEFFTPGNDAPNYFQLKVAGTEFCVSVGRATTLADVVRAVQRGLLDPMGWPRLVGLRGEDDDACWDDAMWEGVKASAAGARALYLVVEMEF